MSLTQWKRAHQRHNEDELLFQYWRKVGGTIFAEVIIGRDSLSPWPQKSRPRRIDGVRIISNKHIRTLEDIITFSKTNVHDFERAIAGAKIEVVEVKPTLWRGVIGQAIIGVDLLEMVYQNTAYRPASISAVIVCKVSDPLLEQICQKRNIRVEVI